MLLARGGKGKGGERRALLGASPNHESGASRIEEVSILHVNNRTICHCEYMAVKAGSTFVMSLCGCV